MGRTSSGKKKRRKSSGLSSSRSGGSARSGGSGRSSGRSSGGRSRSYDGRTHDSKKSKKSKKKGGGGKRTSLVSLPDGGGGSGGASDGFPLIPTFDEKMPWVLFTMGAFLAVVGGFFLATAGESDSTTFAIVVTLLGVGMVITGAMLPRLLKDEEGDPIPAKVYNDFRDRMDPKLAFFVALVLFFMGTLLSLSGIGDIGLISGLLFMTLGAIGMMSSCFLFRNQEKQDLEWEEERIVRKRLKKENEAMKKAASKSKYMSVSINSRRKPVDDYSSSSDEEDLQWRYTSVFALNDAAKKKKKDAKKRLNKRKGKGDPRHDRPADSDSSDEDDPTFVFNYEPHLMYALSAIFCFLLVLSVVLDEVKAIWPPSDPDTNIWIGPGVEQLVKMGALSGLKIRCDGEFYRFFSPIFLHLGLIHLAMNLSFQLRIGVTLERIYGPTRIGVIYFLSGFGGNLVSAVFNPGLLTAGASGSLYGLLGVVFIDLIQNWWNLEDPKKKLFNMLGVLIFTLGLGLFPGLDNFAHLGGMITGIFSGIIFLPTKTSGKKAKDFKQGLLYWATPMLGIYLTGLVYVFYQGDTGESFCPKCYELNCLSVFQICQQQQQQSLECEGETPSTS